MTLRCDRCGRIDSPEEPATEGEICDVDACGGHMRRVPDGEPGKPFRVGAVQGELAGVAAPERLPAPQAIGRVLTLIEYVLEEDGAALSARGRERLQRALALLEGPLDWNWNGAGEGRTTTHG